MVLRSREWSSAIIFSAQITESGTSSITDTLFRSVYLGLGLPCGTKFFRIGQFLCFVGTNFCDQDRLVFRKYEVPSIDDIFVFIEYVQQKNIFSNNTTVCVPHVNQYFVVNRFISTRKKPVEIEQKRFLSTVFCVANLSQRIFTLE